MHNELQHNKAEREEHINAQQDDSSLTAIVYVNNKRSAWNQNIFYYLLQIWTT